MPSRHCVTNCRGIYNNGPKVSIFKFPEQPVLYFEKPGLKPSQERILSQVIHQGFVNDTLLQQIFNELKKYLMRLQKKINTTLGHPRLVSGAIPKVFPDCPSYLSSNRNIQRESMDAKKNVN